jgi:hypothetical protein
MNSNFKNKPLKSIDNPLATKSISPNASPHHPWNVVIEISSYLGNKNGTLGLEETGHHPSPTKHFRVTSLLNMFNV